MPIWDEFKRKLSVGKKSEMIIDITGSDDKLDAEQFFSVHQDDKRMKERDHYYEKLKDKIMADARRSNTDSDFTDNPLDKKRIYLPAYATRRLLKDVADNGYNRREQFTFFALKSCLDFIMQKNEVEPWVVWRELAEFKRYQYDGGGNVMTERREMLTDGMRYMGEKGFLADEKKLRENITSYNNSMGWDRALQEGETRESRQKGIDEWIEREIAEVMDIQKPYENKASNNNLMGKIVQIRDDATKTENKDNKPKV